MTSAMMLRESGVVKHQPVFVSIKNIQSYAIIYTCNTCDLNYSWYNDIISYRAMYTLYVYICSIHVFNSFSLLWTGIQCQPLEELTNGSIMYSPNTTNNFMLNTTAMYTCDNGFFLVGDERSTCIDDDGQDAMGVWSLSTPPTCVRKLTL